MTFPVPTLLCTSLMILLMIFQVNAQDVPSQQQVLDKMHLANSYFMNIWTDPGADIVTDRARPSNIWTRATYYEGLMALYTIDPRQEYYDYAVQWGESHNWAPAYNRPTRNADNQACGQTYIDLYLIDPKPERVAPIKQSIDQMVNSGQSDDWWWIDALQMSMPVFARLGVVYADNKYFEKMFDLYNFTKTSHGDSGLYNRVDHLWWRDADFDPPYREPNGEDCYWSRGDGWVFTALARVLDVLPEDAPHRDEYITTFKEMAEALLAVQRTDGFWNVSLHDPNNFGGKELTGTGFFTYGMAWGINNGLLSEEEYKPAVINAWNGMANDALHPNGFLGYVQGTGKEPSSSQPVTYTSVPNFEDFGLGAFLLAGCEVYKLIDETTAVGDATASHSVSIPAQFMLHPAHPNPFNSETTITYILAEESAISLAVYDSLGHRVHTILQNARQSVGEHKVSWRGVDDEGQQAASGIYIVRLQIGQKIKTQKITLIR